MFRQNSAVQLMNSNSILNACSVKECRGTTTDNGNLTMFDLYQLLIFLIVSSMQQQLTTPIISRCGKQTISAKVQEKKEVGMQLSLLGQESDREKQLQEQMFQQLRKVTSTLQSGLFEHVWKTRETPKGNSILSLRAMPNQKKKGLTSWPTPCAEQANGEPKAFLERKRRAVMRGVQMGVALTDLNMVAKLSSWPSPDAYRRGGEYADPEKAALRREQGHQVNLSEAAQITHWPTPQTHDDKLRGNTEADNHSFPHDLSNAATLASWATPKAEDSECAGAHRGVADTLTAQSSLAAWASPSARDWKDTAGMATTGTNPDGSERSRLDQLPRQANLAGWHTPTANPATYTGGNAPGFLNLPGEVKLASWPTPAVVDDNNSRRTADSVNRQMARENPMSSLAITSTLASWPTPMAGTPAQNGNNEAGNNDSSRKTVELASWPTPNCPNGGRVQSDAVTMTQRKPDGTKAQAALENVAQLSGPVRLTAGGQVLTGSDAVMENSARCQGQLNPAHSAWLMGISPIWDIFCFRAGEALRSRRSSKKAKKE
jgi:hypothetical protein